jgi:hypothetical protein
MSAKHVCVGTVSCQVIVLLGWLFSGIGAAISGRDSLGRGDHAAQIAMDFAFSNTRILYRLLGERAMAAQRGSARRFAAHP